MLGTDITEVISFGKRVLQATEKKLSLLSITISSNSHAQYFLCTCRKTFRKEKRLWLPWQLTTAAVKSSSMVATDNKGTFLYCSFYTRPLLNSARFKINEQIKLGGAK